MESRGDPMVEVVLKALRETEASGAAGLRYVARMTSALPSLVNELKGRDPRADRLLGLAERGARFVAGRLSGSSLPGPDGVIDFHHRRARYSVGASWRMFAGERDYHGRPGEWWVVDTDRTHEDDPFWLLGLVGATHQVTGTWREMLRGVRCQRYDGYADFHRARDAASGGLAPPIHAERQELTKLPIQVWIEDAGRIRQATYWGEGEQQTRIELSDYGQPSPLELPNDHELVPDEA